MTKNPYPDELWVDGEIRLFANGTEGMMWNERNCFLCVRYRDPEDKKQVCNMLADQVTNYVKPEVFKRLGGRDEDGWMAQCTEFQNKEEHEAELRRKQREAYAKHQNDMFPTEVREV